MIFNIAICDDKQIHRNILRDYLGRVFFSESYEVMEFGSGEELLRNYPNKLDILLLDVKMTGIDGIETAKKIRIFDSNVRIIFTTSFWDCIQDGYEVKAFRYLLKPIKYNDFSKHLTQCKDDIINNDQENIIIKEKDEGKTEIIPINSILYIETESSLTLIHTYNKTYKTKDTIKKIEKELKEDLFYRCHRSYLINLSKVKSIDEDSVFVKDNKILVSRYKMKDLKIKITDVLGTLI